MALVTSVSAKGDKGDSILTINFISGDVLIILHW